MNVTVSPGSAAGLYSVLLRYYVGGTPTNAGIIYVNVATNGSYTFYPYNGIWPALTGANDNNQSWITNGGPNANFSVNGDLIYNAGDICDGSNVGTTFHGTVNIQIGTPLNDNTKPCDEKSGGDGCKGCGSQGMARYSAHSMLASLNIEDTPIGYTPPRGPSINFTATYNQRDNQQPQTFSYSNLSARWTFNWLSYVTDDPNTQLPLTAVYVPGGGAEAYAFDSGTQTFSSDPQSHATLVRTSSSTYEKRFPDGSKQVFAQSNGATSYPRKLFMTQWVDPAGNAVTISYDSSFRITAITDALGQATTLSYELSGDPLKVTKVTDPFLRYATFEYQNGQLWKITDPVGIVSQFHYITGTNFIDSLTTPYGTTNFATGLSGTNRWIEMTDPLGGKERVEYRDNAPGINATDPSSTVPSGFTNSALDVANTFYWDKKATQLYPPVNGVYDYTKARVTHWLYNLDGSVAGIASSKRAPLENRVWHKYAGQSDSNHAGPSANSIQVARILDDASTQLWQYEYNNLSNVTKTTDPSGRVFSNVYAANGIDVLEKRQTRGTNNELLASFTYNSLHKPLTATDAANKTTIYTYNSYSQVLTITNAKNETTTYGYGGSVPTGYLASITSPQFSGNSAVTSFTYDSANRVRTVTNSPDNYTVTTDYDALDRPIKKTYPDTTFEQFKYTDNVTSAMTLDLTATRDRRGRWTYRHYNGNRQMDSIKDPLTRETLYGWCTCGSLTSITDPRGKTTTFNRDLQSRVTSKVFGAGTPDSTTVSYLFENTTSRLKSMTDALNQTTNYQYFGDDNLKQASYTNAQHATPTVSFTYDPNYNRVATMVDGFGTTNYSYYPITSTPPLGAGQLQSVNGPLANATITYLYDELGRSLNQSINGVSSSATYDSLGRISTSDNALGHFTRAYDGVTPRLQTLTYPTSTGQTANYTYFDNTQDRRLQTLQNLGTGAANISKFDYTNDAEGQILTWAKTFGTASPATNTFVYDLADQVTGGTGIPSTGYTYDLAGNRTHDLMGHFPADHTFNNVNQTQDAGYTYDANGNLTSDSTLNYEWDAANRLTAIQTIMPPVGGGGGSQFSRFASLGPISGSAMYWRTEFSYDGLGRRVRKIEMDDTFSGDVPMNPPVWFVHSDNRYVWSGNTIAEERDTQTNAVTKRFFAEGEQISGVNYYFTRDHLGSVREMTDSTGAVRARYAYGAFGERSKTSGDLEADFGFTGHYYHPRSGLHLSLYRAYSATLGRWLSRDPLRDAERREGPNVYLYCHDDPINRIDAFGLDETFWQPDHGRSWGDGPRNGNYGGKNWTGGLGPGERGPMAPPTDSADKCYCQHDFAYGKCEGLTGVAKEECIRRADARLLACLFHLPDNSHLWPMPPRPGTERDSELYRSLAITYFGAQFGL